MEEGILYLDNENKPQMFPGVQLDLLTFSLAKHCRQSMTVILSLLALLQSLLNFLVMLMESPRRIIRQSLMTPGGNDSEYVPMCAFVPKCQGFLAAGPGIMLRVLQTLKSK